MQEWLSLLILAIVQGATEWLPISSSGHLVLAEALLGYDVGLDFEIALHFGTLMAAFIYFGRDIVNILEDLMKGKWKTDNGRTGLLLALSSVPAVFAGYFFYGFFETTFESMLLTGVGFAITGVFLFIASIDLAPKRNRVNVWDSVLMGVAQAISILPSISRSGATIATGLIRGLDEKSAMRFSFLMSIPVIFGASLYAIGSKPLPPSFIWAAIVSFIVGIATIHVLFKYTLRSKKNLRWFGAYCLILAVLIIGWVMFF